VTGIQFLILSFAVYRITAFLVDDLIPFGGIREWIVDRFPPPHPNTPGSLIGYAATCASCTGVWVTLILWGAWSFWPEPTLLIATPFAVAGAARAISRF
jgi:hypothetical protein